MLTVKGKESQKFNCWLQINIYVNFKQFQQPTFNGLISTLSHCYLWAKRIICLQVKKATELTHPSSSCLPQPGKMPSWLTLRSGCKT